MFLDEVYRKKSRFAAVFISQHYAAKRWTTHERQSIQARALNELGPYLLPVRLDDSDLPGLRPTIGYVDARRFKIEQLVDLIQEKLDGVPGKALPAPQFFRVPRTAEENHQLLAQRPSAWEHLLYTGILLQRRDTIEDKWRDHDIRYARRRGYLNLKEAAATLSGAASEASAIASGIVRVLDPRAQEAAFGAPGEPGDPDRIEHLAGCLISLYEEFLDWAAKLRGVSIPEELRHVFELAAQLADKPIQNTLVFIDELVEKMDNVSERLDRDGNIQVSMELVVEVDEQLASRFSKELDRVMARLE